MRKIVLQIYPKMFIFAIIFDKFFLFLEMKQTAFVTGATSGIGRASARKLAEAGFRVIISARRTQQLETFADELRSEGHEVLALVFDVRDRDACKRAVQELPLEWSKIDVLVNNAGLALGLEPAYDGDFDDWDTMIDTNIKGLLNMTRFVVPGMVKRDSGMIINIGSVAGDAAYSGGNVYCATKAAVKTITDGLRIDLAQTSVRVTNIKPGLVETEFSRVRFHGDAEKADKVYSGIKPLTGEDIADVVVFAAKAPAHVQIAEVLVLATHQGSGSVICRRQ